MGSWNGTKLGLKVNAQDKKLAEQFLQCIGVDTDDFIIEEVGELSDDYSPSVEGVIQGNLLGIMPRLEKQFSSFIAQFYEDGDDEDECEDEYDEEYEDDEESEDGAEDQPDFGITLEDLFCYVNSLFPPAHLYLAHEQGNNTSDDYYRHEEIYDPLTKRCTKKDCYYSFGEGINVDTDSPKEEGTVTSAEEIVSKEINSEFVRWMVEEAEAYGYGGLVQRIDPGSEPHTELNEARGLNPNFFADVETLNCLLRMSLSEPSKDIDLTLDLIDLPVWFSFSSNKKSQTLKAYSQRIPYTRNEELALKEGLLKFDRASQEASTTGFQGTESLMDMMENIFVVCLKLNSLILEKGIESLYAGLDPEEAGILLMEKDGKLDWKVVSGTERPDLEILTFSGDIATGRPYMDEDLLEDSTYSLDNLEETAEAAEAGSTAAMEKLAMLYLNGDEEEEIEPDPGKSVYWFRKLADSGKSSAMFNLGLFYAKGHGVKRDFKEAVSWFEKAAEAGDDDAMAQADTYRKLSESAEGATAGDAQAQADLAKGLMRLAGSLSQAGTGDDYAESIKWARLAADQGNADAMWVLALAYEHGRGVDQNKDTAVEYYTKGAELGNTACQHSLGCYYARGDHLKKDNKKAFELFQKSAAQGYGLAMKDLGKSYQFGVGCKGNMKSALEWYEKAAEILEDPELDQRIEILRTLADLTPDWDKDYPGEDNLEKNEIDSVPNGLVDEEAGNDNSIGNVTISDTDSSDKAKQEETHETEFEKVDRAFTNADRLERELYEKGYLPDLPAPKEDTGVLGEENYPRVRQKAFEGDEEAIEICKVLGWSMNCIKDNDSTEKGGVSDLDNINNDGRVNIGGFFTMMGTEGMIFANVQKEQYENGDTLTTLFDTTGGRDMEMGLFGGIANGLILKAQYIQKVTEDGINRNKMKFENDFNQGLKKKLAEQPGLFVFSEDNKVENKKIRTYVIITHQGVFMGRAIDASPKELAHYDQVFASAYPCQESMSHANKEYKKKEEIKPQERREGERKQEQAGEQRKRIIETNIRQMDRTITELAGKLKEAEGVLNPSAAIAERMQKIRAESALRVEELKRLVQTARQKLEEINERIRQEEETISSLGLFAISQKRECKQKIANLKKNDIPEAEKSLQEAEANLKAEERYLKVQETITKFELSKTFDRAKWVDYRDSLSELLESVQKEKDDNQKHTIEITENSSSEDIAYWNPPQIPEQPRISDPIPNTEIQRLMIEETLRGNGWMTIADIIEKSRFPYLANCNNPFKISSIIKEDPNIERKVEDRKAKFALVSK